MTLHWWMHWFWVTAQLAGILAIPLPSTTENPKVQDVVVRNLTVESRIEVSSIDPRIIVDVVARRQEQQHQDDHTKVEKVERILTESGFRVAKAINSYERNKNGPVKEGNSHDQPGTKFPFIEESTGQLGATRAPAAGNVLRSRANSDKTIMPRRHKVVADSTKRDSRITWVLTSSETPASTETRDEISSVEGVGNLSTSQDDRQNGDLTVLPLRVDTARFKLVVNRTRTITADSSDGFSTRTFNGSEDIEIDQELSAEPGLSATAASILQAGISDSTRLSRARNAFTSDFQRDREEDRSSEIDVSQILLKANESVNRGIESSVSASAIDIAAITGSCLATIVLLSTMASLGFIMYRRKYLNPPQTLNSDKCSNPDSSGYIDDSTIRDNSEEMYSLDNDSFLNSLEAMTIQNYWTDSVKHTKL